jgi:hypothetical protein
MPDRAVGRCLGKGKSIGLEAAGRGSVSVPPAGHTAALITR